MNAIYQPKGRAREYSPLALNLYTTCAHGCQYCYCRRLRGTGFDCDLPKPRAGIISALEHQIEKDGAPKQQVMLSFMGDPFGPATDGNKVTFDALRVLADAKVPVAVLTKSGTSCLRGLDAFKTFGEHIMVGQSLTFFDEEDSNEVEPGAASPQSRLDALKALHGEGIKTFASFEPVIDPEQSLRLIEESLEYIDVYKVGKINNWRGVDKTIDWPNFTQRALDILRGAGKAVYVKEDLRRAAVGVKLYGSEVIADDFSVL